MGGGGGRAPSTADARPQGSGTGACGSNLLVSSVLPSLLEGSPCFRQGIGQKEHGWLYSRAHHSAEWVGKAADTEADLEAGRFKVHRTQCGPGGPHHLLAPRVPCPSRRLCSTTSFFLPSRWWSGRGTKFGIQRPGLEVSSICYQLCDLG